MNIARNLYKAEQLLKQVVVEHLPDVYEDREKFLTQMEQALLLIEEAANEYDRRTKTEGSGETGGEIGSEIP